MEQHDLFCVLGGIPLSGESAGEISVYVNTSGGQGFAPTVLCSLQVIDLFIRYMQWCQSSHCSKLRSY